VPACDEEPELVEGIAGACRAASGRILCIVVVNAAADQPAALRQRNRLLLNQLAGSCSGVRTLSPATWIGDAGDFDLLVIDRSTFPHQLASGEGVGLARRIGCDLALALHADGKLASRWLFTTDADVELPLDYFERAQEREVQPAALSYPFWHVGAGDAAAPVSPALALYELSLRHYVLGLRRGRPRFAFHTLGSAIAIEAGAYAAVRGVPRRLAGEDFYLLNKAARLGVVAALGGVPIRIRERSSMRVPFGTGPATARIAAELSAGHEPRFYHPRIFELVGLLGEAMAAFVSGGLHAFDSACETAGADRTALAAALAKLSVRETLLDARRRTTSAAALARRLDDWLDGFRVLKLVHALRDSGLPSLPWNEALVAASLFATAPALEDVEAARRHLFSIELATASS
jgi:hypothetical protein